MEINKEIEVFKEESEKQELEELIPSQKIRDNTTSNELALVNTNKELTYPKSAPDRVNNSL